MPITNCCSTFANTPPDADYLIFVLGLGGVALTFLVTLSVASRANSADSYTFFSRLPSRVEYLVSVLLASLSFSTIIQIILTILALVVGKSELTLGQGIQIPPIWLALNIFAGILALHATDFSSKGWSRTYLFGGILLLLFSQGNTTTITSWVANRFLAMSTWFYQRDIAAVGEALQGGADWLFTTGNTWLTQFVAVVFWPFHALADAILAGGFTYRQALAPAAILLYATALFFFASDLLARKDLFLTE